MFVEIAKNEWINMGNIGKIKESEAQVRVNGQPKNVKGITMFDLKHDYFDSLPIESPQAKAILKWLNKQDNGKPLELCEPSKIPGKRINGKGGI